MNIPTGAFFYLIKVLVRIQNQMNVIRQDLVLKSKVAAKLKNQKLFTFYEMKIIWWAETTT